MNNNDTIIIDLTRRKSSRHRDMKKAIKLAKTNGWALSTLTNYHSFKLKFVGEGVTHDRVRGYVFN